MKIQCENPEAVAKRAMFLAYQAARPVGMGFLHERGGETEEFVTEHIRDGRANGDYIAGRMLKLYLRYDADSIEVPDHELRSDYQSWCGTYLTYETLIEAAKASLLVAK